MEDNVIEISLSELEGEVKKDLASAGKRIVGKDGSTAFATITTTQVEDAVKRYTKKGIYIFLSELAPLVYRTEEGDKIKITLHVTRVDGKKNAFEANMRGYVTAYAQMKVYELSLTEEAKRNLTEDMQRHQQAAVRLIYNKEAPKASGKKLSDMQGGISFENIEDNVKLI